MGYDVYRQVVLEAVPKNARVMVAGCGNSYFMEDMVADGYKSIVGADISRVVLKQMKNRCADLPEISFFQGNMIDSDLPEKSFDAIIDKALFDSILCSHLGTAECNFYIQEVVSMLHVWYLSTNCQM